MTTPNPPTFGIEIELLVVCLENGAYDGRSLISAPNHCDITIEDLVRESLSSFLSTTDFGALCNVNRSQDPGDYSAWTVTFEPMAAARSTELAEFRHTGLLVDTFGRENCSDWIKRRCAGKLDDIATHVRFAPVEIISPILPATAEGFRIVQTVFEKFVNQGPYIINKTCGLHVHVGTQKEGGPEAEIPLAVLKNLMSVAVCAEYQLACLQPKHRQIIYNESVKLNTSALRLGSRSPASAYRLMNEAGDRQQLVARCTADRTSPIPWKDRGINILTQRLPSIAGGLARTVEFRAGAATMSGPRAVLWVRFVTDLFRAACMAGQPWARLAHYDSGVSVEDMLEDLGLEQYIGRLQVYRHSWDDYVRLRDAPP